MAGTIIRLSTAWRLTIGLVCLSVSVYLGASWLGLLPDRLGAIVDGRRSLCEAIAIHCALAAERGDLDSAKVTLKAIVRRDPQLRSAALRGPDGKFLLEIGSHRAYWAERSGTASTPTHMTVPIRADRVSWGTLELCFADLAARGPLGVFRLDELRLIAFLIVAGAVIYYLYLRKVLTYLNPADVIPQRVRNTLDTLADGLLVLDRDERIILANETFAKITGESAENLQGRHVNDLPWSHAESAAQDAEFPWTRAIRLRSRQSGDVVRLEGSETGLRTFKVNSSPILSEDGSCRGALASFDDVTLLEERTAKLGDTLQGLKRSRDQVRLQNEQLATLATLDPLTGCLNRRALFEEFEKMANGCQEAGKPISCLIIDLDEFKAINDTHGHLVGDMVLQQISSVLVEVAGKRALVGRYGGEEFCVVFPRLDMDAAAERAEQMRAAVQAAKFSDVTATASFGVASTVEATRDRQGLIDQADQAMYAAKRSGRNRVVRFDEVPDATGNETEGRTSESPEGSPESAVSFRAAAVLLSVLNYRHSETAEHCRRVADLCVAAAAGLMSQGERYILEIAALLHDIGKLGIPDSILLNPGRLTDEELKTVRTHSRFGVEILATAFDCSDLTDIVRHQNAWFNPAEPVAGVPLGEAIPLGARLLFIAEAYDAMVVDQVHRQAIGRDEAFAELRRFAGTQFDPGLIELFIASVQSRPADPCIDDSCASRHVALRIGMQIDRLACALESEDRTSLFGMAGQLKGVATQYKLQPLAEAAAELEGHVAIDPDWDDIVQLGSNLLEICRTTQSELLREEKSVGVMDRQGW